MHPIQDLCMELSVCPINGSVGNDFSDSVRQKFSHGVLGLSIYDLLKGLVDNIVVTTNFEQDASNFQKSIMKSAYVFLSWSSEPILLDLMPIHMELPRFPEQVFDMTDDGEGVGLLALKDDNPWFDDIEEASKVLTLIYLALTKMVSCGNFDSNRVIESVHVHIETEEVEVRYQKSLKQEVLDDCLAKVTSRLLLDDGKGIIEHFALHFIDGMVNRNAQTLESLSLNKTAEINSSFKAKGWTEEMLALPFYDHLFELSFERDGEGLGYISHAERMKLYCAKLFEKMNILSFPLSSDECGVDVKDFDEFQKLPAADVIFSHIAEVIFEITNKAKYSFGDLIELNKSISKIGIH